VFLYKTDWIRLVQIKESGHGSMYEYPDKFSRLVLTFLES